MANIQQYKTLLVTENNTINILSAQSESDIFSFGRVSLCSIIVDEVLSGAVLNFKGAITTSSLHLLSDGATVPASIAVTVPALGAGEKAVIPISPALTTGILSFQVVINGGVAAADTVIELGLRPV